MKLRPWLLPIGNPRDNTIWYVEDTEEHPESREFHGVIVAYAQGNYAVYRGIGTQQVFVTSEPTDLQEAVEALHMAIQAAKTPQQRYSEDYWSWVESTEVSALGRPIMKPRDDRPDVFFP